MSYSEVKKLPIRYRKWFLDRLAKHFHDKNSIMENTKNNNTSANQQDNSLARLSQFENQMKK